MQGRIDWKGKMLFDASFGDHRFTMDANPPIGGGTAATPKQLVVAGICGCTAMDVAALLRKYRQEPTSFWVEADAPTAETHPQAFKSVHLVYGFEGTLDAEKVKEAIMLSMTKYCGVNATIAKGTPITYDVVINGQNVGSGKADFPQT